MRASCARHVAAGGYRAPLARCGLEWSAGIEEGSADDGLNRANTLDDARQHASSRALQRLSTQAKLAPHAPAVASLGARRARPARRSAQRASA